MEKIEPGKYVEMVYDLYAVEPSGETLVHQVEADDPEKIIFGVTPGVIKPLEKALEGLQPGGKFDIVVSAAEGFGMQNPDDIAELDKSIFEIDGKFNSERITPGAIVPMITGDGFQINGKVVKVTDQHVVMDFNHPMAGKDARFKGYVKTVRDATEEELHPTHCGCGGCHDNGSGCGGGCCGGESGCEGGCCN